MRLDPRHFVFVGADTVQICAVRSREKIARLKEVNVCVDVTRQNEFAYATDLFSKCRRVLLTHRYALDLIAIDHYGRVRHHLAIGRVDHGCANERNFLGVRRDRDDK